MLKKIFRVIVLVLSLILFTNVSAKEYYKENESNKNQYVIFDDAEILNDEQVLNIQDKLKSLTVYGNIAIKIVNNTVEYEELDSFVNEAFNNWKKSDNKYLMIYINVKNDVEPRIYNNISIKNSGFDVSDSQLKEVVWKVTPTLREGNVENTILQTIDNINGLSAGEKEGTNSSNIKKTSNYKIVIEDDANLLSEEEKNKLMDDMMPLTEYGHAIFKSINKNDYSSTYEYGKNYYYDNFKNENGTLLLIDMDLRYVYIISGGDNYNIITTAKSEIITDNVYKYLSNQNYYEGASIAFHQINQLLQGYKIAEPMRYASNVVISLVLAFFVNFLIIMITCSPKKSKKNGEVMGLEMALAVNSFQALSNGTHRVYSPVSESSGGSSGGGHSGGGHSGGGGFSGGGGGHRF